MVTDNWFKLNSINIRDNAKTTKLMTGLFQPISKFFNDYKPTEEIVQHKNEQRMPMESEMIRQKAQLVRFEILMAVRMMMFFWVLMPYRLIDRCLHLQG